MHQLYKIIISESKKKTNQYIINFKTQRRKLLDQDFGKYLRYVRDSLIEIKNIDVNAK